MKIKPLLEIKEFCQNVLDKENLGIIVWDTEFKNGDYPTLTIYIHKEGGVDLDMCEKVSNILSNPLDELNPTFDMPYSLNISSRGIDYAFREEDFISHINKRVEVKLKSAVKGKKFFDGILLSYDKNIITVKVDEKTTLTLDLKNVIKVNEYIDFE